MLFNTLSCVFFFQAEDGIRDLVRSRGLGDVYKRQLLKAQPGVADQLQRSFARCRKVTEFGEAAAGATAPIACR